MADTRTKLLDHFDEEVHRKLRINLADSRSYLDRLEWWLWEVARFELADVAEFRADDDHAFDLRRVPEGCIPAPPLGRYRLARPGRGPDGALPFRVGHPLAEHATPRAQGRDLPAATIRFDYSGHPGTIGVVRNLVGRSGWLALARIVQPCFCKLMG